MKKRTKHILLGVFLALILVACGIGGAFYYFFMAPQFFPQQTAYVYIDRDDTADSVYVKVQEVGNVKDFHGFKWMSEYRHYPEDIQTGRYEIKNNESVYNVFSRIWRGYQTPMNITINSARTMKRLAGQVGRQLMIDSLELVTLMYDSAFQAKMGYTKETMPALFIPETYEMYWDISVDEFFERMQTEQKRFWNTQRKAKAQEMGLTENEVATLASIVEEETNNNGEKPSVAGLYYNRLRIGMPLQADPTIKFALQEFGIRRILNSDLNVESPYNTYLHRGVSPGPIRIPSVVGLDAVQIHAAHFFYLSKFISPLLNHRTDHYGGDQSDRSRILYEILKDIHEKTSPDFLVTMKINSTDEYPGGLTMQDFFVTCKLMANAGIDAIEVSGNGTSRTGVKSGQNEGYFRAAAMALAEMVDVPIVLVGGLRSVEKINQYLDETKIEYMSLSCPLIREPNLIQRWQAGDTRPSLCVSCNTCYRTPGHQCMFNLRKKYSSNHI